MDKKYAGMAYNEYVIPVKCRVYADGNRTMFCPICEVEFDHYLLAVDGFIGCKYCMGRKGIDILAEMIKRNIKILVDGKWQDLDMELAKAIGIIPKV